jgi:uncharacterized protein (TIGR02246 family)
MTSGSTTVSDELAALGAVPQRIIAAWAANDADAFAAVFTEDATMVLPGDVFVKGKDGIRAFMAAGYAGPYRGSTVTGDPIDAKFVNDSAAILVTEGGVLPAGATTVPDDERIRATWVLAKQNGNWLITGYHNSPVHK